MEILAIMVSTVPLLVLLLVLYLLASTHAAVRRIEQRLSDRDPVASATPPS